MVEFPLPLPYLTTNEAINVEISMHMSTPALGVSPHVYINDLMDASH